MEPNLLSENAGRDVLLSGNEAIARGCVEAGVTLVTGYPGTPTTPVIEILRRARAPMQARFAINEKVAMDIATGHSWAGQRSLVTMKMSGLNVASDTVLSVAASGTTGGLVIYVGDDPGVYYGMVEQDSRYYALLSAAPMLVPANPQEMLEFTRFAFDLSEKIGGPVFLRSTTVLSYTYGKVTLGEVRRLHKKAHFPFDVDRYTKAGAVRCRRQHEDALARVARTEELADSLNPLTLTGSKVGIVASSLAWDYLLEVLEKHDLDLTRLKVATSHPVPHGKVRRLLEEVDRVLVLEELEPIIEWAVRTEATRMPRPPGIFGKEDGLLPRVGDLSADLVRASLSKVLERELVACPGIGRAAQAEAMKVRRLLTFCAGCPHRSTYYALAKAMVKEGLDPSRTIVTGDVGCTILGINEPFSICWSEVSMGNSVGLAAGLAAAGVSRPVVAALGDGTFFHAGIPPIIDAVTSKQDLAVLVLDNNWAAMTGYQETPSTREGAEFRVPIESVARGAGAHRVWVRNPYRLRSAVRAFRTLLTTPGVNVLIMRAPCVARQPTPLKIPVVVDQRKCPGYEACERTCVEALACPAILRDGDRVSVDEDICMSCGLCSAYCPKGAIRRRWLKARRRTVGI